MYFKIFILILIFALLFLDTTIEMYII